MALHEVEFASANGRDTIFGWIYEPVRPARGIIHLIHGLGEHSRRYLPLIVTLLDEGFVVVAGDHAGHGKTAMTSGVWGDAGDDADRVVVEDEWTLQELARDRFPELPVVVFGHSWGSMIARGLAQTPRAALAGLVLGGIAAQMEGIEQRIDRVALAAETDTSRPAPDAYGIAMFTDFTSRYGEGAGPTDWIAADADVVRDHGRDPLNNFGAPLTTRFLQGFVALYDRVNGDDWYGGVPASLPVLILAGDADPVANFGEGAYHVGNRLIDSGHADVRVRVYSGFRHEVHNEPEIRADVAREIVTFASRATS
ncbi:alpha/beta fold hydrolase [Microbacterium sp. SORGH_AS_0888]|uniref:alpha/beta fold hydrolase n=1 Tax=Microbacterium sp. SORGH_AS_0888 TaxID=3041791 RepID=UPI002788CF2F|nr:alpha/beta fold hydrolase [Microbacterium sp. SORGH_AS_0888]MDQ1130782.1 alpha-beta hydrolase superfamily lysophospholipase [Microbacterium sp. SORGH_AS_0888]